MKFQSYQSKQINPDSCGVFNLYKPGNLQFQSYQSKQINPDLTSIMDMNLLNEGFQSYQSKQINPDELGLYCGTTIVVRFNRINPNRSILTIQYSCSRQSLEMFQSYQSKQINPDCFIEAQTVASNPLFQSYQSKQINPDLFKLLHLIH